MYRDSGFALTVRGPGFTYKWAVIDTIYALFLSDVVNFIGNC